MTFKFNGKGFLQHTGHTPMANINLSPITINGSSLSSGTLSGTGFPQLTASQLNTLNTATFDFSSLTASTSTYLQKYEMYESIEPLLALSCAAHRIARDTKAYHRMTDREVVTKVTPEDRVLADQIKDYYSKKVMMWKLKGDGKLSKYREDMNKLVHSDGLIFRENMIGLAYWLYDFYQYDLDFDLVKREFNTNQNFEKLDEKRTPHTLTITETLVPVKKLLRKTKSTKAHQYWFKDTEYNSGVVISLGDGNPLQHIWDKMFDSGEEMKIEGAFTRKTLDDFEHYSVRNWKLK